MSHSLFRRLNSEPSTFPRVFLLQGLSILLKHNGVPFEVLFPIIDQCFGQLHRKLLPIHVRDIGRHVILLVLLNFRPFLHFLLSSMLHQLFRENFVQSLPETHLVLLAVLTGQVPGEHHIFQMAHDHSIRFEHGQR